MGDEADRGFAQLMGQMSGVPLLHGIAAQRVCVFSSSHLRPAVQMHVIGSPSAGACQRMLKKVHTRGTEMGLCLAQACVSG